MVPATAAAASENLLLSGSVPDLLLQNFGWIPAVCTVTGSRGFWCMFSLENWSCSEISPTYCRHMDVWYPDSSLMLVCEFERVWACEGVLVCEGANVWTSENVCDHMWVCVCVPEFVFIWSGLGLWMSHDLGGSVLRSTKNQSFRLFGVTNPWKVRWISGNSP
jgi:hypothetical protein